jgi:hypothetical protein
MRSPGFYGDYRFNKGAERPGYKKEEVLDKENIGLTILPEIGRAAFKNGCPREQGLKGFANWR